MDIIVIGAILFFCMLLMLTSGIWVALTLTGTSIIGLQLIGNTSIGLLLGTSSWSAMTSWSLTALPLFIWMGEILYRTRLSEDMFRGLAPWMRFLPGGLLHTNIAGCTIFAAVSGSSAATLNMVGKMSIPELRARGYPEYMIIGTFEKPMRLAARITNARRTHADAIHRFRTEQCWGAGAEPSADLRGETERRDDRQT